MAPKTIPRATAASLAIATLLALLLLAALPATAAAQDTRAMVRVIHLSAGVPKVDLYVDGTRTVAGVPFRTASRYHSLPAGAHTLVIRPAGSSAGSTPLASVRASITAGAPYSAALLGASAQLKAVVARTTSPRRRPAGPSSASSTRPRSRRRWTSRSPTGRCCSATCGSARCRRSSPWPPAA